MKIYYLTPFSSEKRLGHIHNEYCKIVPNDDDWIVLNDPDVMYLHPHQQAWIESVLMANNSEYDLFGVKTNRIGVRKQMIDITYHATEIDHKYDKETEEWVLTGRMQNIKLFEETNVQTHINQATLSWNEHTIKCEETDLIAGFCMIFKKSLWNKIKFEESIQFDIKFCNAVKKAGGKIGIMKGIYLFHAYRLLQEDPKNYKKHLLK